MDGHRVAPPCRHAPSRATVGPYTRGQCWRCWLALNTAEYGPAWGGAMPADPLPIPRFDGGRPVPRRTGWGDLLAAVFRRLRIDRLAKRWERATGHPCGCAGRQDAMNRWPTPGELWARVVARFCASKIGGRVCETRRAH